MHRTVFTVIVMLSAYLLSLRLLRVLEVNTSVGRRCSTIVGEDLSVMFVCWGLAMGTNPWRTMVSSGLARENPRHRVIVMLCCWCRLEPQLVVVFPSILWVWLSGVSLVSFSFWPLSVWIYLLGLFKSAWSWRCGGQHCWGRVIPGGLRLAMLRRISFVSCSFFCYSWPLGYRKA